MNVGLRRDGSSLPGCGWCRGRIACRHGVSPRRTGSLRNRHGRGTLVNGKYGRAGECPVNPQDIKEVSCVGAGLIGYGWATNYLLKGLSVRLYDPAPEQLKKAENKIRSNIEFLRENGIVPPGFVDDALARTSFTTSMAEAVSQSMFIQESGPESYTVKRRILEEIERHAPAGAIFASSTSGLLITEIAKNANHPERCLGAHPYNPPHLIPLVEISGGEKTSPETVSFTCDFYELIGKEPVVLQKEAPGFIANRLAVALYREAVDMVMRGVCTVEDVDKAMSFGLGLRYAALGPNLLYHLGGGDQGIRGILEHIGPSIEHWWADMADWKEWPEGWPDMAEKGIRDEMAKRPPGQGRTVDEIARFRDDIILTLLKKHGKL